MACPLELYAPGRPPDIRHLGGIRMDSNKVQDKCQEHVDFATVRVPRVAENQGQILLISNSK